MSEVTINRQIKSSAGKFCRGDTSHFKFTVKVVYSFRLLFRDRGDWPKKRAQFFKSLKYIIKPKFKRPNITHFVDIYFSRINLESAI